MGPDKFLSDGMRILVLSDLHIGPKSRFPGLDGACTDPGKEVNKIASALSAKNLSCDAVVVPGDLTESADPALVDSAERFTVRLLEMLQLCDNRLIVVPGNHDTNWDVQQIDAASIREKIESEEYSEVEQNHWFQQRYSPWRRANSFSVAELTEFPYWHHAIVNDALFLLINTAAYDGPGVHHHGLIRNTAIDSLNDWLASTDIAAEYRIAVFHHHPFLYSDPTGFQRDFSALQNAEALLDLLGNNRFDIAIHGHRHIPTFRTNHTDIRPGIHVLGAGSFGVTLPTVYNGLITNCMHLIEIDGRDQAGGEAQGKVYTWSYLESRGWVESGQSNVLNFITPFGPHYSDGVLKTRIGQAISESLDRRGWVEWEFLTSLPAYQEFSYLRYERVERILESLSDRLQIRWVGESLDRLVILGEQEFEQ